MTGYIAQTGLGRYQASRNDTLWLPRGYARDGSKRGVVYCHGAGELAYTPLGGDVANSKANEATLLAAIGSVYPMVSIDAGIWSNGDTSDSDNWGNTNAQTETTAAITWLKSANGGGAKTGKVIMFGISMGHVLSMNYAQANSGSVQAIGGVLPLNDLDDLRDNDRGSAGYRESISAHWAAGGQRTDTATVTSGSATVTDTSIIAGDNGKYATGPGIPINTFVGTVTAGASFLLSSSSSSQVNVLATAGATKVTLTPRWTAIGTPALSSTANPAKTTNQTNLGAIPQRLWYASDDAICTPATVTTLQTNLPIITLYNCGTGGHSDASVGHAPIADVLAWLASVA